MKRLLFAALVLLATFGKRGPVEATSCGGAASIAQAVKSADSVFLGTVVRVEAPRFYSTTQPDGSVAVQMPRQPLLTTFAIHRSFRGRSEEKLTTVVRDPGAGGDVPFADGETWLVYAHTVRGQLRADSCSRTRLRSAASQDLVYLDGLEQRRPQGVLSGDVLRQVLDRDGRPALRAIPEPLQIVAVGGGRRIETTTDRWGPYQLVLPPGEFVVWVERAGRRVSRQHATRITDGGDRRLLLPVDYQD